MPGWFRVPDESADTETEMGVIKMTNHTMILDVVRVELGSLDNEPAPDYEAVILEWGMTLRRWSERARFHDEECYAYAWLVQNQIPADDPAVAYAARVLIRMIQIRFDTAGSASVQHYIETGRYLTHEESAESARLDAFSLVNGLRADLHEPECAGMDADGNWLGACECATLDGSVSR